MSDNSSCVDGHIFTDGCALEQNKGATMHPAPIDEDPDTNAFGEITVEGADRSVQGFFRSFILVVGSPTAMVTAEPEWHLPVK